MGKLLLWIGLAIVVMLLVRLFGPAKRGAGRNGSGSGSRGADASDGRGGSGGAGRANGAEGAEGADPNAGTRQGELIMACSVCGVHVPASDAVFARGRVYCGTAHRDSGEP